MADLDEPVNLTAHDPRWADRGGRLVRQLSVALRELTVDIEHIP